MPPTDTFFTTAPDWTWLVVLYFFFGGLAGGSYFLAALLDLFGDQHDRALSRMGYYVAFPLVLLCGVLLILDLTRPERFWHMMLQSQRLPLPMLKYWSPMSIGSWGLLIFGAFSFASFIGSLVEEGVLRFGPLGKVNDLVRHGRIGGVFALIGSLFGFFLAGYTGVLLAVTNRPLWADNVLLGLLFLASGGSTAAALLILLGRWRGALSEESMEWLLQMDRWAIVLELIVLIGVLVTLGPAIQVLLNIWGVVLLVGVVLLGILVPLAMHFRPKRFGAFSLSLAALLVLIGGFILRTVIVFSSEAF